MTKKKTLIGLLLAVVLSVVCSAVAACAKPTMYNVEWSIPETVTVAAEGYDTLPEEVADGTVITFTVTPATGYEVAVKINKNPATATDGKYSLTVNKNSTVSITATEILSGIEVTANPTNLTYYAGDTVDTTGMVVKANYATGNSKTITTYSIRYTGENQAFAIGDTAFKVEYEGFTAQVNLEQTVAALVTINPVGGVFDDDFISALTANTEIANYNLSDDGVITFTYTALTSDIVLPETIAHENGDKWSFLNWATTEAITKIAAGSTQSYDIEAKWTAVLVTFNSIDLQMVEGKPCLLLGVTLEGVDSAYLYLLEGNQHLEFVGDEINSANGGDVELALDLSKFSAMEGSDAFYGAWMDIRVMTEISGVKISQELDPIDHANPMAQVGKMIHDDNYCYRFLTWNDGTKDWLKIYFNVYNYTYDVELNETEGKVTADFTGTISANALGNYALTGNELVSISFGDVKGVGSLKQDGTFALSIDLTNISSFNKTAGAITVYTSEIVNAGQENEYENITTYYTDDTMDLVGCGTAFEYWAAGTSPRKYRNTLDASNRILYAIGVDWNELFITAERSAGYEINRTGATLEVLTENDVQVPYLVILGTYGEKYESAEQVKAILEADVTYIDLQNNSQDSAYGTTDDSWDMVDAEPIFNIVVAGDGTYKIYVSLANAKLGQAVFSHIGDDSTNLEMKVEKAVCNIGDTYYVLDNYTGWGSQLVTVYVTTEEYAPEIGVEIIYDYDAELDNDYASEKELFGTYVYGSEGVATDGSDQNEEYAGGIGGLDQMNKYVTYTFTVTAAGKADFVWTIAGSAWNGSGNDGIADMAEHVKVTIDGKVVDVSNIALPTAPDNEWWNVQQVIIKDVELTAGEHVFSCKITAAGGLNVGSMKIYFAPDEVPTDYDIIFGEENVADANAGKWYFWNDQNWCGSTVTVSSATYDIETDTATFVYTSTGSCWFGMQMFYQNVTNVIGRTYTATCVITVETACEVTINGQVVSLNAGENEISITFVEPELSQDKPAASFALQMGKAEGEVMVAANTVSVSGLEFVEVIPEVTYAATGVNLIVESEKAYFTVSGTWDNTTVSKADAEAYFADKDNFYFDFQGNPYVITGSWDGDWNNYDIYNELSSTITVNEDGTWTLKVDLATLYNFAYTAHFGYKTGGGVADFKLGAEFNGITVTANDKKYTLVSVPGSNDGAEYWGCIGLRITDANEVVKTFSISAVDLAEKDGKPSYIITGESQNYTEDDFATDFQRLSDYSYITDADMTVTLDAEAGTFEIVIDLSKLEAENVNLLAHVKLEGTMNKDVEFQEGTDGVIDTITVGGKVYTLKFDNANTWNRFMVILVVTAA